MKSYVIVLVAVCLGGWYGVSGRYQPTWESLDTRPLPAWFDKSKIGIFITWGVYSVPSYGSEWFWQRWQGNKWENYVKFMADNYRPGFTYQDFAPMFTAEFFNPVQWAKTFNASGAQYIVLTSKHHEGYNNWPSKNSFSWNSMDVGPKRDLVGDLARAIRKTTPHIHFGLYYSLLEWFNPLYLIDKANNFQTNDYITRKVIPDLIDIVNDYEPDVIWSDGDWDAYDWYFNSTVFLAWLFNDSPVKDTVVVNDRWGIGVLCTHGSFYSCSDRYNPGVLQAHKWENAMTLDKLSWGYRRNTVLSDYLTIEELLETLTETISCGGNILVNVGPTHDGMLPPLMEERLLQMGEWLRINGEAIYSSTPWVVQNDTLTRGVWFTSAGESVYAIVLNWPKNGLLTLAAVKSSTDTVVTMLGDSTQQKLPTAEVPQGLQINFPSRADVSSQWVWVLKMNAVSSVSKGTDEMRNKH